MALREQLSFETRIVVFLDIMGFQDLTTKAAKKPGGSESKRLFKAIEIIKDTVKSIEETQSKGKISLENFQPRIKHFSDSIILSVRPSPEAFEALLSVLNRTFLLLMREGVYIRGGISHGKISKDPEAPCGPTISSAYRAETELADWPRIVLTESMVEYVRAKNIGKISNLYERHPTEGIYQLCPIKCLIKEHGRLGLRLDHIGPKIKSFLDSELEQHVSNPKLYRRIKELGEEWSWWVSSDHGKKPGLSIDGYNGSLAPHRSDLMMLPSA